MSKNSMRAILNVTVLTLIVIVISKVVIVAQAPVTGTWTADTRNGREATGYPNLTMENLVQARIFKIDADFVKKINDMGDATKDFEQLVQYSIFKVTPEYLAELKSAGFDKLSSEQGVQFRIFHIDSEFIRKAKAADPNVTMEDLVQMKIGVRRMKGTD